MIGGISYFHAFAYDLLAENERITAASFDAAIHAHKHGRLKKITVDFLQHGLRERDRVSRPRKGHNAAARRLAPPTGFRNWRPNILRRGRFEQYGLPYTIARPFNCVGIGEKRALRDADVTSGNVKLAMSHVVPDLVQKVLKGQDPLHILGSGNQVRHYTYGGDLARGIRLCIEHPAALNQDFNLSTPVATTVLELGQLIWQKINDGAQAVPVCIGRSIRIRRPNAVAGRFEGRTIAGLSRRDSLSQILDEVIPWIGDQIRHGQM